MSYIDDSNIILHIHSDLIQLENKLQEKNRYRQIKEIIFNIIYIYIFFFNEYYN